MTESLILFREKPNSTIYLLGEQSGTIYASTRKSTGMMLLWMMGQAGRLTEPLEPTKHTIAAKAAYLSRAHRAMGYVRFVRGWE